PGLLDHQAPVVGGAGQQAEQVHADDGVDRVGDGDDEVDEDVARHVGQHLDEEDAGGPQVLEASGFDELAFLEAEHLGPDGSHEEGPGDHTDDEGHHQWRRGAVEGGHDQHQHDEGDGHRDVGQLEQKVIDAAPYVSGDATEDDGD